LLFFLFFGSDFLNETSKPGCETASQSGQHDEVCR